MSNRFSNLNVPTMTTLELRNIVRRSQWQRQLVLERRLTWLALFLISFSVTLLLLTILAWAVVGYAPNIVFLWSFVLLPLVLAGSVLLSFSA